MAYFQNPIQKPVKFAAVTALVYLATKTVLQMVGGEILLDAAITTEDYHQLDWWKDLFLTTLTALVLFTFSYYIFSQLRKRSEALGESERKAASGTLALAVVHDFNNLLTIASGSVDFLALDAEKLTPENREVLARLKHAIHHLGEMSQRIKNAGNISMQNEKYDLELNSLVEGTVKLLLSHRKLKHRHLEVFHGDSRYVSASPSMVQDAVINLVLNAADATRENGRIQVSVAEMNGFATITVDDNGCGIPIEVRDQVFDAFYTTKKDGTGLGLSSVKACAVAHGGDVWVEVSPLGGTRIVISLSTTTPGSVF